MRILLPLIAALCAGCSGGAPVSSSESAAPSAATQAVSGAPRVAGMRTFVIVPEQSRASYHAKEEFFAGAMKLLGIKPGRVTAVGTTQAIDGKFQLDATRPVPILGDNVFTVRLNTLTSNQQKRDDYLREVRDDGGPSFDAYPLATFKATGITSHPPDVASDSSGIDYQLPGELTVRDISRRVVFDVKGRVAGDTFSGAGRTQIRLSDFGIGPIRFAEILSVADDVELEVVFTARAQPQ
jgi:polyisoprenoid-binding protein YceI